MKTWRRLGPLKVEDFVENTNIPMDFDDKLYMVGEIKKENYKDIG